MYFLPVNAPALENRVYSERHNVGADLAVDSGHRAVVEVVEVVVRDAEHVDVGHIVDIERESGYTRGKRVHLERLARLREDRVDEDVLTAHLHELGQVSQPAEIHRALSRAGEAVYLLGGNFLHGLGIAAEADRAADRRLHLVLIVELSVTVELGELRELRAPSLVGVLADGSDEILEEGERSRRAEAAPKRLR